MDSLAPENPPVTVTPAQPQPRIWKFWGTCLWGVLLFAAMFVGQLTVIAYLMVRHDGPLDFNSLKAVAGGGTTISLSVIMGLPAVLAALWAATHLSRTPFADYLALRWPSWRDLLIGVAALIVLVAGWEMCSRLLGRHAVPGFMVDVLKSAQADGVVWLLIIALALAAPVTEELMVRGFLYRGWSESFLRPVGAIILSSLVWTAMHAQYYDWFLFAEVFSIGLLLGYMRYRSGSTWLPTIMHSLNNLAATVQSIWLAASS